MRVSKTVNILRRLLCARNCAWRTLHTYVIMYRYCTLHVHTRTCTHTYEHAVTMPSLWGVFDTRCVPSGWSNPAGEGMESGRYVLQGSQCFPQMVQAVSGEHVSLEGRCFRRLPSPA